MLPPVYFSYNTLCNFINNLSSATLDVYGTDLKRKILKIPFVSYKFALAYT